MAKNQNAPNSWEEPAQEPVQQPTTPQMDVTPAEAPPEPKKAVSTLPQVFSVKDEDIDLMSRFVSNLTPAQLAVFKQKAAKVAPELGVPLETGLTELSNGEIRATITLDRDLAETMKNWADATGEGLLETIQRFVTDGVNAYIASFSSGLYTEPASAPVQAAPAAGNTPPPAAK